MVGAAARRAAAAAASGSGAGSGSGSDSGSGSGSGRRFPHGLPRSGVSSRPPPPGQPPAIQPAAATAESAVKKRAMAGAAARRAAAAAAAARAAADDDDAGPPEPVRQHFQVGDNVTGATAADTAAAAAARAADDDDAGPPEPVRQHFQVGDNVIAEWRRGQWFLGHVTGFANARYTVYFLDGSVKPDLSPSKVRISDSRYPRRAEMLTKVFFFDGAEDLAKGSFEVCQILEETNRYKCTRVTGVGDKKEEEEFDIGYVIKQFMKGKDELRTAGVGTILSTRTRSSSGNTC